MTDAIWDDDVATVRELVVAHPGLLGENVRFVASDWGPPMSYAAAQHAFERAALQGKVETARRLLGLGAKIVAGSVMGPCETLNPDGLAFLLEAGASLADANGDGLAPVALLLQTSNRDPQAKHRCLELAERHGTVFPDTPPMALHRGRIDLLERHLRDDPALFSRTFSLLDIYPPELGCAGDGSAGLHGTPLAGATLLHAAVDFDEVEIARWMIESGAPVDAPARVDGAGFGGHTALFGCVVSQAYRCGRQTEGDFARLLLRHGADPNARASLRKGLRFTADPGLHEYRDVSPRSWGERFQDRAWVNPRAVALIAEHGGQP